jgi:arylsulfatase A-like enzyme
VPTPGTAPRVPEGVTFVSERLRERGYETGAVVTNPWLKPEFGFDSGFDSYDFMLELPHFARGAKVNEAARKLLEEWNGRRFLLWLHYMDAHAPYEEEPKYRDAFPPDPNDHKGVALLKHGYNAEIRAVDDYVRDLLGMIRELGVEQNTLVVFTSDHGEEFGEHGGFGHGKALYQELVHVPLLFKHPELAPRRIETPVSLVDIAPTILDLITGSVDERLDGISLVPEMVGESPPPGERILFSELGTMTAARRGDKKLIRAANAERAQQSAYDLSADPGEKSAVDARSPWIADLSAAIDAHVARRVAPDGSAESLDPATEERVRVLGY